MKGIPLLLCLLLVGCRSLRYEELSGPKTYDWPTVTGSFSRTVDGIQILRGLPSRPYTVLGRCIDIDIDDSDLARLAKQKHADAVLILGVKGAAFGTIYQHGTTYWGEGWAHTGPSYSYPDLHTATTALLLQYRPDIFDQVAAEPEPSAAGKPLHSPKN